MFGKLFASMYQGSLRGRPHEILVFTNLIAHADPEGFVDLHPRAIADEVGLSREEVEAALKELEAPDPESRSPEHEGRRLLRLDDHRTWGWQIVNHARYRAMRDEDARREQWREASRRYRERKRHKNDDVRMTDDDRQQNQPRSAHAEAEAEADPPLSPPKGGRKKRTRKRARSAEPSQPREKPLTDAERESFERSRKQCRCGCRGGAHRGRDHLGPCMKCDCQGFKEQR